MKMVKIRSISVIRAKWEKETPLRAPYYEAGIREPKEDWATEAAAAQPAWDSGVADATRRKAFSVGVKKVGTPKWQERALKKGVPRYPEGVRIAGPDYEAGFGPYRDEIERIVLPPRGMRGDPKNIERVRVIANALYKKRVGASPKS